MSGELIQLNSKNKNNNNNNLILKIGEGPEQTFLNKWLQAQEKVLNITNHHHNEVLLYTCLDGY